MLEKLKFQELIEEIITVKRRLRAMSFYQYLLSMVLAIYVGFALASSSVCGQGSDADAHSEGVDPAGAEHVLAVSGLLAWRRGTATVASATEDARASVGGSPGAAGWHHPGHRHHGAHHLQPEQDGSTQGV